MSHPSSETNTAGLPGATSVVVSDPIALKINSAFALLSQGKPAECFQILEDPYFNNQRPRQDFFFIRALCKLALGEPEFAKREVARELAHFPTNTAASGLLDKIRPLLKNPPLIQDLSEYATTPIAELIRKAELHLGDGYPEVAWSCVQAAREREPRRPGLNLLRARILLSQALYSSARLALQEELLVSPDNQQAEALQREIASSDISTAGQAGLPEDPDFGKFWPNIHGYTTRSVSQLFPLLHLATELCRQGIPGDFLDCSSEPAASSMLLAWAIKRFSNTSRRVISYNLADALGVSRGAAGMPERELLHKLNRPEYIQTAADKLGLGELISLPTGALEESIAQGADATRRLSLIYCDADEISALEHVARSTFFKLCPGGVLVIQGYWQNPEVEAAVTRFRDSLTRRIPLDNICGLAALQRP